MRLLKLGVSSGWTVDKLVLEYAKPYSALTTLPSGQGDMYAIYDSRPAGTTETRRTHTQWTTTKGLVESSSMALDASLEFSFWGTANTALKTNLASNTEARAELTSIEEKEGGSTWELPTNEVGWLVGKGIMRQSPEGLHLFVPTEAPTWRAVPREDKAKVESYSPVLDLCSAWPTLNLPVENPVRLSYGFGVYSVFQAS